MILRTVRCVGGAALLAAMIPATLHAQVSDDDEIDSAASGLGLRAGIVSDYVTRGLTQTWHRPAAQASVDYSRESGVYAGAFVSTVSTHSYPGGAIEAELYTGYEREVSEAWSLSGEGVLYLYPGANYSKARCDLFPGCPSQRFDTAQLRVRSAWDWLSTRFGYTLSDYFGDSARTGFSGSTRGTWYWEWGARRVAAFAPEWTFEGHLGYTHYPVRFNDPILGPTDPSYWDWRVSASRALHGFAEGWRIGIAYTQASNRRLYDGERSLVGSETTDLGRPTLLVGLQYVFR